MTWQPEITYAARQVHDAFEELIGLKADAKEFEDLVRTMFIATGALSEIERLEARVSQLESELLTERFF